VGALTGEFSEAKLIVEVGKFGARCRLLSEEVIHEENQKVLEAAKRNASTGDHDPSDHRHIPGTGPGPNRATHDLYNSIVAWEESDTYNIKGHVGVNLGEDYPRLLEMGELRGGAQYPFLLPAIQEVAGGVAGSFKTYFSRADWVS
jgi:hypothetical protein